MKYSVIGPNGERYGPVDLVTLNQWIAEGRILATTLLEREDGVQIAASAVPGAAFATQPGPGPVSETVNQPATGYANYPRQPVYAPGEVPPALQGGWNWGAFYFSWIWGLNHKAYITLSSLGLGILQLILGVAGMASMRGGVTGGTSPLGLLGNLLGLVGFGLQIYFGIVGNRWAWQSGRFATVDDCKACQKVWAWWVLGLFLTGCVCGIIAVAMMGMAGLGAMRSGAIR